MIQRLLTATALVLLASGAAAQDAQYWDNQYGTKAQLLGGLVVGSPSDLSATYYNPGWVALGVDPSLLVTTVAFEYSSLQLKGVLGSGYDPGQDRITSSPGFLAGRFNALKLEGWQTAWSYIERMRFRFDASGVRIDPQPLPAAPGDVWQGGEAFRQTRTDESWYGFTFARRIGRRAAFGVTPYFVYRSQQQRVQGASRVQEWNAPTRSAYIVDEFNFNHYRLLAKVGLAFDYEPVTFGLTLTTPGLGITGGGKVHANFSLSGYDLDGDGQPDDFVLANAQNELSARWRSPLSLAAGVAWRHGGTGLHFTAEWFAGVDHENVLDPAPFTNQGTGGTESWDTGFSQNAVLNFGLGVDHRFDDRFALYAAVRSDWSTLDTAPGTDVLMSTWDLWHFTVGSSFQFLGIGFTSGLQYTLGNGVTEQYLDFSNLIDDPDLNERVNADVRYRRLKLVVGFDLALLTGGQAGDTGGAPPVAVD
jgi:hypothetical protein